MIEFHRDGAFVGPDPTVPARWTLLDGGKRVSLAGAAAKSAAGGARRAERDELVLESGPIF
jgi:hypothetical protein